jgi:hypothetical protein
MASGRRDLLFSRGLNDLLLERLSVADAVDHASAKLRAGRAFSRPPARPRVRSACISRTTLLSEREVSEPRPALLGDLIDYRQHAEPAAIRQAGRGRSPSTSGCLRPPAWGSACAQPQFGRVTCACAPPSPRRRRAAGLSSPLRAAGHAGGDSRTADADRPAAATARPEQRHRGALLGSEPCSDPRQ